MHIGSKNRDRGVTYSTSYILPGPDHSWVQCKSIKSIVLEGIDLPSGENILGAIVLLDIKKAPSVKWTGRWRGDGNRTLVTKERLRIKFSR
jgi:hypothetical protein